MANSLIGHRDQETNVTSGWMITFADLLSLLLTFFVLLFSMSTVEFESWKAVVATMSKQFNLERAKVELTPTPNESQLNTRQVAGLNLNYLRVLMERAIAPHAAFEGVTVVRDNDRIVISIPSKHIFEEKETLLVSGGDKALAQLAGTLAQIKNRIRVAGFVPAGPLRLGKYRSHWELSLARARTVAGILTDSGYRHEITILGYAERTSIDSSVSNQAVGTDGRIEIIIAADDRQDGIYGAL
jgi:chemotaxis protein MotB